MGLLVNKTFLLKKSLIIAAGLALLTASVFNIVALATDSLLLATASFKEG